MAKTSITQLKSWFRNGLKPTQAQFWNWMDSYWHKDEKLPMDSIEGIDEYFDSVTEGFNQLSNYAQRDAQNLEEDDIIAWKEALKIGGSNDVDVKLTQTHELLGLDESNNQAEYNTVSEQVLTGILETLPNKMNTPEEVGDPDDYPFIVGMNEDGDTAQLPSTGLGKNIGNSDLTISEPRILNTDGKPFSITNLPDKSADATFIDFLGKSRSGQMAKIGFQAFKQQVNDWNDTEKLEFATILNGGVSTGTMSVFSIMPQVFELENDNLYITLNGANLALNPIGRKIEIIRASDGVKVGEVPNSQISEVSANRLTFYYNFFPLGAGDYQFRLTNGVIVYTTNLSAAILSSINNIDLSAVTWDIQTDYVNTKSYGSGDTLFYKAERYAAAGTLPIFSGKSSELFTVGEDFYLELNLERVLNSRSLASSGSRFGVGYSNQVNELLFKNLNYGVLASRDTGSSYRITYGVKGSGLTDSSGAADSNTLIIVKQGNLLRVSMNERTNVETISNNSGYSLFIQAPEKLAINETNAEQFTVQITKAYKF